LRDRRQPRAADERVGEVGGRPRPGDVSQAGDDPAAHARRPGARPADRGGARGGGGHGGARGGGAAMRQLAPDYRPYEWAMPTPEVAALAGIDVSQVLRFDQNTPLLPLPSTRPGTIAGALARVSGYPGGGYVPLRRAIADYAGVEPENVVLGAGADDLILLVARAYAGPGDTIAIPDAPTYPLYKIAAELAGAIPEPGSRSEPGSQVLTFACRPNNPTRSLDPLPDARPLVVDEAYFEYCVFTDAAPTESEEVIVLRTFSK